jgi:hypothetical protein
LPSYVPADRDQVDHARFAEPRHRALEERVVDEMPAV